MKDPTLFIKGTAMSLTRDVYMLGATIMGSGGQVAKLPRGKSIGIPVHRL